LTVASVFIILYALFSLYDVKNKQIKLLSNILYDEISMRAKEIFQLDRKVFIKKSRFVNYLDLFFADRAGCLDSVGALVAELGHGLARHQLEGPEVDRNSGRAFRILAGFRDQQKSGELCNLLLCHTLMINILFIN